MELKATNLFFFLPDVGETTSNGGIIPTSPYSPGKWEEGEWGTEEPDRWPSSVETGAYELAKVYPQEGMSQSKLYCLHEKRSNNNTQVMNQYVLKYQVTEYLADM